MYPIFIGLALALSISLGMAFIPNESFLGEGIFLGILAFFPTVWLLGRRASTMVAPLMQEAGRLAQAGKVDDAIAMLKQGLEYRRWHLALASQIHNQIGTLLFAAGKDADALEHLKKGYPKVADGHLFKATIQYRQGNIDEAIATLELGTRFNKKSPILYCVRAWMLEQQGRRAEAITVLSGVPKKIAGDTEIADNLARLQSDKKMNLRPFGDMWFLLRFEAPAGTKHAAPLRKGFRQGKKPTKAELGQKKKRKGARKR